MKVIENSVEGFFPEPHILIVIVKILEVAFTQVLNNYRVARCEIFKLHLVDSN